MDSSENRLEIPRHLIPEKNSPTAPKNAPNSAPSSTKTLCLAIFFLLLLMLGLKLVFEPEDSKDLKIEPIFTIPDPIPEKPRKFDSPKKTCTTRGCQYLVENLMTWIDWDTSPCDNFYQHACSGYAPEAYDARRDAMGLDAEAEKAMESVEDWLREPESTVFSPSEEVFLTLYQKCEVRGDKDFDQLYEDVRYHLEWPFDPEDPREIEQRNGILEYELYRLNDILTKILKLHLNSLQLFHVEGERKELRVSPTFCRTDADRIDFDLIRPYLDRISGKEPSEKLRNLMTSAFLAAKTIDEQAVLCGANVNKTDDAFGEYLSFDKDKGIDFEKLLRAMWGFNRKGLLARILEKTVFVNYREFTDPDSTLNRMLQNQGDAVANWLVVKYIEAFAKREAEIRELGCSKAVSRMLPRTALQVYVNHVYRPANYRLMPEVLDLLKEHFKPQIAKVGPGGEKEAMLLERIDNFETELGALGTGKDVFLASMRFNETDDSFYRMSTRLNRFAAKNAIDYVVGESEMCLEDERTAARSNLNRWIPMKKLLAPMLLDPLIDSDFPAAVSFGRAGSVIGREMGDLLNPRDARKVRDLYWEPAAIAKYERNAKCFLKATLDGSEEKPAYTIQRQINADHFGVTAAWHAFRSVVDGNGNGKLNEFRLPDGGQNVTDDQLFFYSMIQMKCNKKHRLLYRDHARMNGVLAQIDGFADAFRCPPGSPMNPEQRCSFGREHHRKS